MEKIFEIKILKFFLYFVTVLFLFKIFEIQILKGEFYEEKAIEVKSKKIRLPSKRGRIFDRSKKAIAYWRTGFRLLREGKVFLEDVSLEEIVSYLENPDSSKIFSVYAFPYRFYPYKNIYAQTIGFTGLPSEKEIKEGIDPLLRIGKSGIEKFYDEILRGKDGYKFLLMDAKGRVYSNETRPLIEPVDGEEIYLTLDFELGKFIDSLFKPYKKGACVVFKPGTGEVLALYSKPSFDLNLLTGKREKEELLKVLNDTLKPLLNRTTQGLYPPGSIFKVITSLIALEEGLIDTNEFLFCQGKYRFGDRVFKDWKEEGHGRVNFFRGVEVSCDVYFYEVSKRIGLKKFLEYFEKLKIFDKTGIDLPDEKSGFYPTIKFYETRYGRYGYGEGNALNLGIGQGEILMTPIEIALLFGAIALDGKCKRPCLLENKETDYFELPFKRENIGILKRALFKVVQGEEGTARLAGVRGLAIGGKTGTAQNPGERDHAQFASFFPFEHPEYVLYLIVEESGMGGEIAAPLAGKIMKWIYEKYIKSS